MLLIMDPDGFSGAALLMTPSIAYDASEGVGGGVGVYWPSFCAVSDGTDSAPKTLVYDT
jgi:hypothetical protein